MNDNCDIEEISRAADVLMAIYGSKNPQAAIDKAREAEAKTTTGLFAKLVRQEVERRCSACGLRSN